jgi:thymidine phosphorylase
MNQPLARCAGNALEVAEAVRYLTGERRTPRLHEVTLALSSEMLLAAGLAADESAARAQLMRALDSGRAAEIFARMVAEMGGPVDFVERCQLYLSSAPLVRPVYPEHSGHVSAMDARGLGMAVCALGGGRRQASDSLDYRVGLSDLVELGQMLTLDTPLAVVHAANESSLLEAERRIRAAVSLSAARAPQAPLVYRKLRGAEPAA